MKTLKRIVLFLAIIIAVLSLLALFIPYFISLDKYKPQVQQLVSNKVNAKLDYSTARISLFGGIGVTLKDVELVNTEKPFADTKLFTAKDIDVRFDILPLFSKKLVGTVYLNEPNIKITTIGNQNNIESLKKPEKPDPNPKPAEQKPKDSGTGFAVILNEFRVDNADILYKDLTNPNSPTVIDLKNIDIVMIREGEVFNIEKLLMTLFEGQLDAKIKIDTADPELAYNGNCSIKNVSLESIYKSFSAPNKPSPLTGEGDLQFTFNGRGTTKPVYSKNLNAQGTFNINHGAFTISTAVPIILNQIANILGSVTLPNTKIGPISQNDMGQVLSSQDQVITLDGMKGNFTIKDGNFFFKNVMPMHQGQLTLDAAIGLLNSSLKGTATFLGTKEFSQTLVATNQNFAFLLNSQDLLFLKIYLGGTVANPTITVDKSGLTENILLRATKGTLKNLKDTIQNLIPF